MMMDKELATHYLGGSEEKAARWIGVAVENYRKWPARLGPWFTDRVYAAIMRKAVAGGLGQSAARFMNDWRNELAMENLLSSVSLTAVAATLMPAIPPEFANTDPLPPGFESTAARKRAGRKERGAPSEAMTG